MIRRGTFCDEGHQVGLGVREDDGDERSRVWEDTCRRAVHGHGEASSR